MLNKISAKNFLSWKQLEFSINEGITLIDGWNDDDQTSEGSGKSAILNAVSWGLYGKLPKEANVDDVIRHGEKGCEIEIQIGHDIVKRSRKPNDLAIMKYDGKEFQVVKGKDARETQQLIEELVGLSFDAFCQSVYFAQNDDKNFLKSNQESRGKILSEIQDLEVFDKARKEVMSLIKIEEKQLTDLRHNIQMTRKDIEIVNQKIDHEKQMEKSLKQQKDSQLSYLQTNIEATESEIEFTVNSLKEIAAKLSPVNQQEEKDMLKGHLDDVKQTQHDVRSQITNAGSRASEYERLKSQGERSAQQYKAKEVQKQKLLAFIENPTKNCPTCNTLLENCDTSHAKNELDSLEQEMKLYIQNMEAVSKDMSQIELRDVSELKQELSSLENEINRLNCQIRDLQQKENNQALYKSQIENTGQHKLKLDQKLEAQKQEYLQVKNTPVQYDTSNLLALESEKTNLDSKLNTEIQVLADKEVYLGRLETLKSGFKEIKSYVFNSALNEINVRVSKYLEDLFEVPVSLQFVNDNMKIGTKLSINGNDQGLGLFSGGQTRRLSLATDLALSDVVSSRKGNSLGLLVLDEYFKDLSEQSMEKCLTLLESRNQPVLLVEHNSVFKNIVNDTFFVNLKDGVSSVQL